ncbi:VCBS domain-containing protein [Vibrio harveyi]|uniref:VCBS domain-containing protein n=3 Tax=Vibrio harveyi TaxID=669 RepID=UPI0038CD3FD1
MENSDKLVESSSTQKNASLLHEDKNLNEGGTEEVKALAPTPSHHLASHSHPIIHRLTNVTTQPSISNTIDSNTQTIKAPPTHTNPTTPQSQTYVEETIQGTYGQLHVDKNGNYQFTLAAKSPAYLLLQKQEPGTDTFTVHLTDGTKVIIQVPVMGKQDSPTISGQLSGHLEEDHNVDSHGFLTTSGKVDVLDPDHGESELIPDMIHGQFGSLSINSQGYWQYTVDNSQSTIQALTNNTSLTETFTIHTKDGTPQVLQMSIGGENDNALVSGNDKGQVYEDLSTHITGKLSIRDADTGEDHFSNTDIVGSLGTLHLTNSGQWTYDLDNTNAAVQALGKGSTVTDTITVHSVDGTPHQVIITINGTNDAAVVSSATVAVDETDKAVTTSGALTSTDIDNPNNTFTPDSITGTHGDLTIDANGHWVFTANNAFNQLNVGDKVEETFTVTSIDGTPSTIKVTINGTNDAATVSSATVAVDETDTAITTSGTLTSTDVDNPDNTFTPDTFTGNHGDLTIDATGHWVFTANSAFNQLNVGDKVEETFTVTSIDGTPSTIKVTINGTNDAATVSSATIAVDETDTAITTSGTLTSTDVDNPDNAFTPDSITGTHGDLTIDANGYWVFTANSAFNQLNIGDKVEETFTVTSVDGTPSTIKVTINGTNDAATVSSATVAVDETDKAITTSGTLTSTDVDNPDNTFTPDSITGTHGDLTIDANGYWVFTANSAFNQLNIGDKVEETFTVTSVDGTPSTIKVTINGTNDAATVSSATVAVDETDKAITTSGTLTSTDVDNPDNTFTPDSITGTHGDLTIDANGHWVFTANSAFNQLNVGDKVEETFTVTSVDGTPSTIKVTINGTNDTATVSSATVAVDEMDSAITTSGTLTSTDVDNPDNAFTPDSIKGTHGDLIIDANGHWVFTANNAFNQLNVGDKVEETFTVTSVDGTPSTIKVTINGTNDAATISSATVVVDETYTAITTSGNLTSTDVDNPNNTFTPGSITGTHGNLTIDTNGHWVFTANSAFNQLNVGDKVEETFTVTSVDGTQSTVKVTINGTNDAATISSATVAVDETDTAITTSGTLTSTDIDNPDNTFTPASITGTHGDLTINANGHWVFTANSAFNQLNVGDKVEETFTVTSVDGTPSTIKVTINGTNDAATVSRATVAVDETDKAVTTFGTLTSTDVDNQDNAFTASTQHGTHGDLTIDGNGHWVFTANSEFNQLNVGDKVEETFTVTSVDGTPSTIKVTINGTNDAATVSSATVVVDETDTAITTSGTLTSTDVDNLDNTFTPASIAGNHGDLTIDSNGHWVFTANSAFNQLNVGDKVDETFTVASVDGTQSTIKVTINGTNDRPTISGTSSGAVIEQGLNTSGTPDATGSLTATDLDKSDTVTWAINQPQGQWGTLSIDQNGHWHYQLDNSTGGAADKLAAGEHQSESFWITATDSAGATVPHKIVIDVQGSNDKPIVSAWTQLPAGKEDQPVTIKASDLLTHASDVDGSDVLHVTNLQATHGSLTDNKDGTYTFTPGKDFNGEIRLTYDVVDGHGGSVSTQAKFDLTATPDNAIITDAQTNADLQGVTEDRGYIDTHYQLHYDGKLNIQDPDAGEAQFDPNIGPQTYQGIGYDTKLGGHILLMRDGHYTYTLDNRNIQNLAQGEVKHDSAVIRSVDGTTHTIELTVHGTNDAPTINAQSHSVTEGGSVLNGQMVGQDIDTGATLTYSAPQIDGLVVNPDGSYSFNPAHSSYQSLASGVTKTLTVPVTVTDEHNASSTQNLSITITGVNNSAVIGGVDTGDVHEGHTYTAPDGSMSGGYVDDRSPDHMHGNIGKIWNDEIHTDGHLNIVDPDSGEGFAQTGTYQGTHGHVILQSNGDWSYYASIGQDATGRKIDHLGQGESITDTVTVKSADGTTHDIHITIHGDNDRPYCSSEVQLNSGKEDLAQTITTTELLTNTVDVDTNDAGQLSIANLHADHGTIVDNKDGTFTFTPTKDYNGSVHFTYDVKDAHGGTTHTGANTTLVATPDKAIISEVTTGSVIEDGQHATHNNGTTTELANGRLQVIDPDSSEDKFQYSQFGETRIHDPFGGMLRIDSAGNWGYSVNNAALQHLAQGQVETVTYRVHSFDGTAYDLNIDVVGTNDAPTVTKVVLSNGTEDINYQMQASQFGFTDVDTGDTLHSITITGLPPATQGKFVLDGHDITAGQSISASDIAKLQFVPNPNFNGDVQFKFTVNDGHIDSQEATNTLHIDAVSDVAKISGTDTGDVYESTYADRSPDYQRGIISHLWNDSIHTSGKLDIVDHDAGEAHFDNNAPAYQYFGQYGRLILQTDGDWYYTVDVGNSAVGRKIDALNTGENLTDTITVRSADGTPHDVVITIHGDNDAPFASSEVQLQPGKEDQSQTFTQAQLLANSIDVDSSDAGKLSVDNLRADHGSIRDNQDGTYTFTPDHNYNGLVHFTYDVKDAHGGVTQTGASTTLLPSNDAATLQSTLASNFVTEEHLKSGTSTNELWSGWKNLDIQDIDSPSEAKVTQIEVNGVKHTVPANFAMNLAGVHGTFNFTHSTDGHDKWSYSADNSHTEVQSLSHGESLTDTITLITADGTRIPLTAKILGTDDHVIIDTPDALTAALGTAVEDKVTSISGTLLAHDSDSKDSVTFTAGNSVGSYGTLHVDSNGQWHYDLDHSKANALQQGETKAEGFDITAISTDGSTATKHIEVLVQGSNDKATISVISNPDVYEDRSSTPVEIISGKLSALDPDHDQSAFSTDVGKRHDPFNSGVHGGLHISKDGSWTYTVNNSQIQQLAAGQEEHVQYNVHTVGGDYHVIDIKIVGTNDIPTVSATTLAHGTEDTHYQMQASQFGFTDVDTGDTLHSIAITDLPPTAQGKFVLDGHDITAGQSIATADIAKLQFVPATDFNGDVQFKYTVNDGTVDSTEATGSLHLNAVNDGPTVSNSIVDAGATAENTDIIFTETQLLAIVHAKDVDTGDNLSVSDVKIDPAIGSFSKTPAGDWLFHPVAHVNATDAPFTISVTDGHVTKSVDATATLDITAVTDPAVINLAPSTEHHVVTFDPGTPGFVISDGVLPSGPLMKQVSFEVTMIGSGKPAPTHGDPTLMSYSIKGDDNALLLTNPHSLAVWIHGTKFDTHVDANDGHDHRLTVSWNADNGSLKLFDNGHIAYSSLDQNPPIEVAKGGSLATGGVLAFGEDQDAVNPGVNAAHGFHAGDGDSFSGTIFQGSMAKTIIPDADVAKGLLGQMLHGHPELLTHFIMGSGGALTDTTGNYHYGIGGNAHTESMEVSLGAQPPEPGSTIKFNADIHATDPQDKITSVLVSGLPKDTVLSDGHGHSHTSTGFGDKVDVTAWDKTDLQATFDHRFNNNAYVSVEATTHSPAGDKVVTAVMTVPFKPSDVSTDVAVSVDTTHGNEDGNIDLLIHAVDIQQPNANIDVVISNLPAGSTLSTGTHDGRGNWHLTAAQLIGLQITPPKDFNGGIDPHVVATSTRIDGSHGSANADGRVNVVAVADSATFSGDDKSTEIHEDNTNHLYVSGHVIHSNQHKIIVHDPDAGENFIVSTGKTATNAQANDHGQWVKGDGGVGEFVVNANGTWDYKIDNTNTVVQSLKSGEKYTDTITIQSKDGTSHTLTVEVAGTDDKPTITVGATQTVTEDGTTIATGMIATTDVDTGDTATMAAITNQAGTYGHLTMTTDGQWTYTLDNSSVQVQGLRQGQVETDTFTVTSTSSDGSTSTKQLGINVTGTNDAPILNVQEQSFNDDNHQSIDMTLPANLFTDPEGDTITYSLEMVTTSGVSSLPSWLTFDPSTLKLTGTPPPEVSGDFDIRVTATDSHGASNNEDFHIAVQQLEGDVKEDGRAQNHQLDATGQLDAYHNGQHIVWHMKADGSDSLNHADGQYGHLSVSTGGTWHYVIDHDGDAHYANSDLNALRGGQVVPDSFTLYGYQNGQLVKTETIHIQVEGTNDKPTIRGVNSLTTDENSIVSGKLDITDVDKGESFFNQQTITSTHGEFVIEKDGNWHFSPNQAAQSLTSADSVVDTVEISSVDGTKHSLSVTVNGLGQPVLGVTDFSIQMNEDTPHTFTAADFSSGKYDQLTISSLPDASHGTLTLNGQPVTAGQHIAPAQIGQLVFAPAQNYHGDATFGFSVSENGLQSSVASAHVKVDSVTDAASIHIHTVSDAVMQSAQGHGLAVSHLDGSHLSDGNGQTSITAEIVVRMKSGSNTNPDAVILQFGHAAAKGTMMNNPVALEEHTGDGSYYGTHHGFSVTNPQNLTLWMPGHMPIQTGIDTTTDSGTHRYTFTVDTASHSATVFEDGAQAFHTDSAQIWHWIADLKGTRVRLSGEFAGDDSVLKGENFLLDSTPRGSLQHFPKFIAERMGDNGLNLGDGLHPLGNNKHEIMGSDGQMHAAGGDLSVDAKFSSAVIVQGSVTASQVAAGPLNAQTPGLGDDKVLLDLGVQGGQIVDHTGHQSTALEHHSLNSPLIGGDPLHHDLNLDVQATDPDDHVTSVKLTGLPDGTMLDDGHGHTATVHNGQAIDVQDWNRASIGVVLPNTAPTGDVHLHVEVTTTGPDGTTATSSADNTSMHVSDVMTDTAPDIIQSIMLGDEDQTYHFSEQDFGFSDKDGDPLDHVTITQLPDPAHGQLLINGQAVTAGQKIPVYDIGNMFFQPAKDFNGDVDFQYSVSDGLKDSAPSQGTLTIAPVDDAPVLAVDIADTSDNVLNTAEAQAATISGNLDPSVAATLDRIEISDGTHSVSITGSSVNLAKDGSFQVTGVDLSSLQDGNLTVTAHATSFDGTTAVTTDAITKYSTPTISVSVDTRNAHHVTAGITASTVQAYAHSIGQHATTTSGHHEIKGHGHDDIIIVQGRLNEEAELEGGNDILYIGGRLTDKEIEGGHGSDTLILGAYNRNNAPRLHDHGEKISDGHEEMELEDIENIILGDGTVLKGHLPPNFPSIGHDHYEVPVNIQAHLSSSDESVSSIRLTHLQQGLTLQSNGHNINANQDGSYTVPTNGHLVAISAHPISSGHHYFETEVTTHNSVTGVTAVTTEDLHGHIQSHVNPPPPPPPPVQHDEPDFSPLDSVQDFTVTLDDSLSADAPLDNHAQVSHEHPVGAAAYLDALGIQPNASPTKGHDQPADMDIVLAQVDQQHAADYDQTHLDMSDALEHHDAANNHNQDDEHHHHNDVDGLPDIDPNN